MLLAITRLISLLIVLIISIAGSSELWSQGCGLSQDIPIGPNSSSDIVVNVQGLVNNDLSLNQSLCGVRLVFSHDRIENIRITLVSPAGQELVLAGPGRLSSDLSPFINWNVLFNACQDANMPDPGISETWSNEEPWASFNNYMGTYDPFGGCLEDFNTGPANGTWVLRIENLGDSVFELRYFEIIFCENTGIDCEECLSFPGDYVFNSPGGVVDQCQGYGLEADILSVDLIPVTFPGQLHQYVISRNDTILSFENIAENTADLMPGFYTICSTVIDESDQQQAESVELLSEFQQLIADRNICAGISSECISLRVLPSMNEISVDTLICEGDTVNFRGIPIFEDVDTVFYVQNFDGTVCDSVIYFSARIQNINIDVSGLNQDVFCGQSVFLNALNSTSNIGTVDSYTWSSLDGELGNTQGPIVEIRSGGNYTLAIRSGICVDSLTFEISGINQFDWDLDLIQPQCFQDSFVIDLITNLNDVELNISGPGIVSEKQSGRYCVYEEGLYMVRANYADCLDSLEINLVDRPLETEITIVADTIDCSQAGALVQFESTVPIDQISITGPQTFTTTDSSVSLQSPGIYTALIVDENGCELLEEFVVISNELLPEFSVPDIISPCNVDLPAFQVQIQSPVDSVSWSGPNGFSSSDLNAIPEQAGLYIINVYGSNSCTASQAVNVSYTNIELEFDISGDALDCENRETELCLQSDIPLDSVFWSFNGESIPGINEDCIDAVESGEYQLLAYEGACFGMAQFDLMDLSEEIEFQLVVSDSILDCENTNTLVELELTEAISNFEIIWLQDGMPVQTGGVELTLDEPGQYAVQIINMANGCSAEPQFSIISVEDSFTETEFEIQNPACFPENGFLVLSGLPFNTAFGMLLNGEIVDLSSLPRIELEPGFYEVILRDNNGCEWLRQFEIEEGRMIDVDLGDDIDGRTTDFVTLNATSSVPLNEIEEINWTSMQGIDCELCLSTDYQLIDNELIVIEIQDVFGCVARDSIQIRASEFQEYFIPNIFSPNGDGNNDDFVIYLSDAINKVFDFRIFDRWGNLVLFRPDFSGDSSNFVWDGFYMGQKAQEGVYIYVAKLLRVDGTEQSISGEITLIR